MYKLFIMLLVTSSCLFSGTKDLALPADASAQVRRLYLDLLDRTPSIDEFITAKRMIEEYKYDKLADQLLKSKEFSDNMAMRVIDHYAAKGRRFKIQQRIDLRDLLSGKYLGPKTDFRDLLYNILTASGGSANNGLIYFYDSDEAVADMTTRVSQRYLALPLGCARCHDHKDYASIKQKDFWALAGLLGSFDRRRVEKKDELMRLYTSMADKDQGKLRYGKTGYADLKKWMLKEDPALFPASKKKQEALMKPNMMMMEKLRKEKLRSPQLVIGEKAVKLDMLKMKYEYDGKTFYTKPSLPFKRTSLRPTEKPREILAKWVARGDNPYTARAIVNWVTNWLYGRSWVMPVYDIYGAKGAAKKELDALAKTFKRGKYNLTELVRSIVTSDRYRIRSSVKAEELAFAEFRARQYRYLSSDQLLNSMMSDDLYRWRGLGSKGNRLILNFENKKLQVSAKYFTRILEDSSASFKGTMPQALYFTIDKQFSGYVENYASSGWSKRKSTTKLDFITKTIIKFYTRLPTPQEIDFFSKKLDNDKKYDESGYFEVIWTLFNSPEMRIY